MTDPSNDQRPPTLNYASSDPQDRRPIATLSTRITAGVAVALFMALGLFLWSTLDKDVPRSSALFQPSVLFAFAECLFCWFIAFGVIGCETSDRR